MRSLSEVIKLETAVEDRIETATIANSMKKDIVAHT